MKLLLIAFAVVFALFALGRLYEIKTGWKPKQQALYVTSSRTSAPKAF